MNDHVFTSPTAHDSSGSRRRQRPAAARRFGRGGVVAALFALLAACSDATATIGDSVELEYDFATGYQGWVAEFADYPVGLEDDWELESSIAALPLPLDITRRAIRLSGVNHSDDLFMYVTRGLADLVPNGRYAVRFSVTLATSAPRNCVGIGGAPGESVVLKVGATSTEPQRFVDAGQYYRTNFQYGSQLAGGRDAAPIGNLATSNANCGAPRYELKEFDSGAAPVTYTADASGRLWLIVGIDSGFEGTTTAYIAAIRVRIDER